MFSNYCCTRENKIFCSKNSKAYLITDIISEDDQDAMKNKYYLRFIKNQYNLAGVPVPINITITVRIGKSDVQSIIRNVLNCFTFPINCRIDFWAIVSSYSR